MKIDGETRFLGLIGRPIAHSLSPRIQNHALTELGQKLVYLPFEFEAEDLAGFVRLFPRIGGIGLNVTTPYKRLVAGMVEAGDEEVAATGIVNTVVFRDERCFGFSTDGLGFQGWMRSREIRPADGGISLLGFGATARSLAYRLGIDHPLTIVTRDPETAEQALHSWRERGWSGLPVCVVTWNDPPPSAPGLVIGGLPVEPAHSPEVIGWLSCARDETIVVDLNYGPGRTPLRDRAADLGLAAHDGLGLLVHQAALSLGIWLGAEVPASLLGEAVGVSG